MIVVIADDITGAAELAGIGLRYGLQVKVAADATYYDATDLLVIYSNTRSLKKEEAINEMRRLTEKALELRPSFIYKKTDSVLRGHVVAELKAQMEGIGIEKALLVPANPGLGRTIKGGLYFVNGLPLHETGFSTDPEYPAKTSVVKEMLYDETGQISVLKVGNKLRQGVNIGETTTVDDMKQWASYQNDDVLLAGGGFFFDVLLSEKMTRAEHHAEEKIHYPVLFVIGTALQKEEQLKGINEHVSLMPAELFSGDSIDEQQVNEWSNEIADHIKAKNIAFIAAGWNKKGDPELLRKKMTLVTKAVMKKTNIRELIVEGGSTAFSIVNELGWKLFTPAEELAYGVVKMKVENENDVFLTIKPGSYPWPSSWDFK